MTYSRRILGAAGLALLVASGACNTEQRATVDSAAGAAGDAARSAVDAGRSALSVIDIDAGTKIDTNFKVTQKTDEFTPRDTIFASVHTSGTQATGTIVGRWTFQDGTVLDEKSATVTTDGDDYTVFSIAKADGFAPGKYTLHVLIDGKEVRSKDVTVKASR